MQTTVDMPRAGGRLEVRDLTVGYGRDRPVIRNFSFDLPEGESLAIVGESGCGKSTLLTTLAGLRAPVSGQVSWAEGNITDVKVTYDEGYAEQMLRYSKDYATLPYVNE